MARTVRAPNGRTWRVRRRWMTHRLRWRWRRPSGKHFDVLDVVDVPMLDEFGCFAWIAVVAGGIALILFAVVFVFPAVVFVIELLVLVLIFAGGVAARVLFRRPWTVEAVEVATSKPEPERRTWQVVGWRASGDAVDRVASHLESGVEPTP